MGGATGTLRVDTEWGASVSQPVTLREGTSAESLLLNATAQQYCGPKILPVNLAAPILINVPVNANEGGVSAVCEKYPIQGQPF